MRYLLMPLVFLIGACIADNPLYDPHWGHDDAGIIIQRDLAGWDAASAPDLAEVDDFGWVCNPPFCHRPADLTTDVIDLAREVDLSEPDLATAQPDLWQCSRHNQQCAKDSDCCGNGGFGGDLVCGSTVQGLNRCCIPGNLPGGDCAAP